MKDESKLETLFRITSKIKKNVKGDENKNVVFRSPKGFSTAIIRSTNTEYIIFWFSLAHRSRTGRKTTPTCSLAYVSLIDSSSMAFDTHRIFLLEKIHFQVFSWSIPTTTKNASRDSHYLCSQGKKPKQTAPKKGGVYCRTLWSGGSHEIRSKRKKGKTAPKTPFMKCAVVLKPPGARLYFKRNEKERAKKGARPWRMISIV